HQRRIRPAPQHEDEGDQNEARGCRPADPEPFVGCIVPCAAQRLRGDVRVGAGQGAGEVPRLEDLAVIGEGVHVEAVPEPHHHVLVTLERARVPEPPGLPGGPFPRKAGDAEEGATAGRIDDGEVVAGEGDEAAVGTEGDGKDPVFMTSESAEEGTGGGVPELDRCVVACGGEGAAVGTEGDQIDRTLVTSEGAEEGAGGGVPEPDGCVVAGGGEGAAVGTEGDRFDPVFVASEGSKKGAGGVPEL